MVEEQELGFWDWCAKICERLTFARLTVLDHKDIKESDYDLLKVLFKPYFMGEYPIFVVKPELIVENGKQQNLFMTECLDKENGKIFEKDCAETIKEE